MSKTVLAIPLIAIVNPKAASGKTGRYWAKLRPYLESLLGPVNVLITRRPEHATELVSSAIREGYKSVIAVGGDGTVNEVVNGFFSGDQLISPDGVLGIIPQGTGSDFCRSLSLPLDKKAAVDIIQGGIVKEIDVLRVRYHTPQGKSRQRYCVNITSFGMAGDVARLAKRLSKFFGGKLAFILATYITALRFGGRAVTIRLDNEFTKEIKISNIAVGNGQFHGSGMWACPRAIIDDGLIDITVIQYVSLFEIARSLPMLYDGRIYEHPKVEFRRAARVGAASSEATLIEIDGEPLGQLPLDISVIPRAIKVYVRG